MQSQKKNSAVGINSKSFRRIFYFFMKALAIEPIPFFSSKNLFPFKKYFCMEKDGKSMFLLNSDRSFKLNVSKISYALVDIICDRLTPRLLYEPLR